jgi:hypothetical protein
MINYTYVLFGNLIKQQRILGRFMNYRLENGWLEMLIALPKEGRRICVDSEEKRKKFSG